MKRALLLVTAVLLAGCSAEPAGEDSAASAAAPPSGIAPDALPDGYGSSAADGVFPRTVTHFGGTSQIPAEPERVVVLKEDRVTAANLDEFAERCSKA